MVILFFVLFFVFMPFWFLLSLSSGNSALMLVSLILMIVWIIIVCNCYNRNKDKQQNNSIHSKKVKTIDDYVNEYGDINSY